jgi:hypothetical protein
VKRSTNQQNTRLNCGYLVSSARKPKDVRFSRSRWSTHVDKQLGCKLVVEESGPCGRDSEMRRNSIENLSKAEVAQRYMEAPVGFVDKDIALTSKSAKINRGNY